MNSLFKLCLSLSFSGSLLIVGVFLCRHFLKHRLSRQWQYYIWLAVIARLLLPFSLDVNLSGAVFQALDGMPPQADFVPSYRQEQAPADQGAGYSDEDFPQSAVPSAIPPDSKPIQDRFYAAASSLWLVVALMLLVRKITLYQSFMRYLKAGQCPVSDVALLDRLAALGEQAGVKQAVELSVNPLIASPMLTGFFRPCIVLPDLSLSEQDFNYTILHELTHCRRGDAFYKWLVQITLCLHWFNPLAHLMAREINKACEFSCDEAVLAKLPAHCAKEYGETLLHAMVPAGKYRQDVASVTLGENKALLKERLGAVMRFQNHSKFAAASAALTVLLCMGAAAAGAYPVSKPASQIAAQPAGQTAESAAALPIAGETILSADVSNGGIELIPTDTDQITAEYDPLYYTVGIKEKDGRWTVDVKGKKARMGETPFVKLSIPNTGCKISADILDGSFRYALPENCLDTLTITAKDSSVDFSSSNRYQNSSISVTAQEKEYMEYSLLNFPDYFTKSEDAVAYQNGTGKNWIQVVLTGFTSVDFH